MFYNIKIAVVLTLLALVSCQHKKLQTDKGQALGTTYQIIYPSDAPISFQNIFDSINQSISTYQDTSILSKINGGMDIKVDTIFKTVFDESVVVWKATQGYFDPTVGTLINAWGFDKNKILKNPSRSTIDSLLLTVGMDKVLIDSSGRVIKKHPKTVLNFNALGKGYCLDMIAHLLDQHHIDNYLIEIGGEIRAKGIHPTKNKPWVIGIDDPKKSTLNNSIIKQKIQLHNMSMATSGNYRKFRIDKQTGEKYTHIIDPLSGESKQSNILSVTTLHKNCMTADAYATALMLMPLELSKKIIASQRIESLILYSDKQGNIQSFMTDGFQKLIVK